MNEARDNRPEEIEETEKTGQDGLESEARQEEESRSQKAAEAAAKGSAEEREEGSAEQKSAEPASSEENRQPSMEEQLAAAKAEAKENYENYLRAVADLDTYRRRVMREKEDLKKYAVASLLESFLPVYDNLSLGMESAEQTSDPKIVVQGLQMVLNQFRNVLEEYGVSEIAPQKGDDYDHNAHEAMQTQPSDEVEEGKVLVLVRKGFKLNDRLVRAAAVIVSGGPQKEEDKEAGSEG